MRFSRPRGTDGSLLGSLPWTLAALVFALAPHLQFLPAWISLTFVACAAWRYLIEWRRKLLPPTWLRAGLALSCFLGVFVTFSSISGVGPGSALLAVMAALKLLETRERRDQFVLLFISIFLVMSSLLREQYIWSLPYLLIGITLIMTAWLRMSATGQETPRQSFASSSRLLMYAAPIALAMWIFFPRIATPFWAVPIDTSRATTGLSDSMSPGDITSLSQSNQVAFRVAFDDRIPEPRDRYWRGLVLTRFNGRSWNGNDPVIGPRAHEQVVVSGEPFDYQVTMEPTRQQWVFALDMPWQWSLERTFMGPQQQLARSQPIDQRIAYEATSFPDFRTRVELSKFARSWYQQVPERSNPRTQALAMEMRNAAGSDRAFVDAVLDMFNRQAFFYTLEPPALGNNPVDQFLFDTRQGFCEHYASAFAVLMRSADIPARIVLGYQGGEINPMGGHLIVRQSDAHAWTEVWLDGSGWQRVDPTAAVAPERIDAGISGAMFDGSGAAWGLSAPSAFLHQLTLSWDAMNAKWNEWVLGYGPENQNRLMRLLGMDNPDWRKMMLTLVAIVSAIVLVVSLLLMLRYRSPPRDRAALLYRRFLKKTGMDMQVGETPVDFAARAAAESALPGDSIESLTAAYLAVRYENGGIQAMRRLETELAALR